MEVFPVPGFHPTVLVQLGSGVPPMGREPPRNRRGDKEELVLPSMDRRWKTGDEGKPLSKIEVPLPSGLRVGSEDKEGSEE